MVNCGEKKLNFCLHIVIGEGVDKDVKRAFELYTLASEQGLAKAQFNLGCMYAEGQSVDQSFTIARTWFTKAALQGNENGIGALKRLDKQEERSTTTSSTVNYNTTFLFLL